MAVAILVSRGEGVAANVIELAVLFGNIALIDMPLRYSMIGEEHLLILLVVFPNRGRQYLYIFRIIVEGR